jgi:hypothetical protein
MSQAARSIRHGQYVGLDERAAVTELARQLDAGSQDAVMFFCSADYDLERLASLLATQFSGPLVGCTTAGEIGTRYSTDGIVGVCLPAEKFVIHPMLIHPVSGFLTADARVLADEVAQRLAWSPGLDAEKMFAMLLIDGLCGLEEPVIAALDAAFLGIPLFGGSAGDSMNFEQTHVYYDGAFHRDAAVLTLIETRLAFKLFKLQHFEPSDMDLVVTKASPEARIVHEINGSNAAEEYAELIGLDLDQLSPQVFSRYPVMLQIGDEWFVRSIQKVNDDGSLTFYCAIDNGLPLTVARGVGLVDTLHTTIDELNSEFSHIEGSIGCDCILRKLELMEDGFESDVTSELARIGFVGFSTYGEQYGAIHVNQTLTGVVLGER